MKRALVVHAGENPVRGFVPALEADGFLVLTAPACASLRPIVRLFRPDVIVVEEPCVLGAWLDAEAPRIPVARIRPVRRRSGQSNAFGLYPRTSVRAEDVRIAVRAALGVPAMDPA